MKPALGVIRMRKLFRTPHTDSSAAFHLQARQPHRQPHQICVQQGRIEAVVAAR